ncbi:ImmA/IrrE family metallo-endopeptidase [Mycobacterium sp. LTG2003]
MWHPWRTAAERYPHINIVCKHKLPRGIRGLLKGDTIWLCKTLTQAERRSTLTHELLHVSRGVPPPPLRAREERQVDELAARKLIPLHDLSRALRVSRDAAELADELWVDRHTVQVRLSTLDPIETAELEHEFGDEWLWIP